MTTKRDVIIDQIDRVRRTLDECRQLALDGDAVTRLVYAVVAAAQREATNLKDALGRTVVLGDPA